MKNYNEINDTINRGTTEVPEKYQRWETIISGMTTDEICERDLLVSLGNQTEEILIFRELLKKEYNKRKLNN